VKSEDLPPDRLGFTRKEVAKLLGVGISTVYKAIETGQIRIVKFGGRVVIPKIELLQYLYNTDDRKDQQISKIEKPTK
jgi:excisionase family DNA binding protein